MADIIALILADHERIMGLAQMLRIAGQDGNGDGAPGSVLAQVWEQLATLIEVYADADEEICCPAIYPASTAGLAQMEDAIADLNDIREAIADARLRPTDSPAWWQAVKDCYSTYLDHFDYQEVSLLTGLTQGAGVGRRRQLCNQWAALTAARLRDRTPETHNGHTCTPASRQITQAYQPASWHPGGWLAGQRPETISLAAAGGRWSPSMDSQQAAAARALAGNPDDEGHL